jgi:hypothetical protein
MIRTESCRCAFTMHATLWVTMTGIGFSKKTIDSTVRSSGSLFYSGRCYDGCWWAGTESCSSLYGALVPGLHSTQYGSL